MDATFGIRAEDKNEWEARVPIVPGDIKKLQSEHSLQAIIQPSKIRAIKESEFELSGAKINESLKDCQTIFAVKEMPITFFEKGKTYMFFSHTIKGQPYNMPMLKKMMDLECNLIDYEKVTDSKGRRLVFFGKWAGVAGMIDSLWAFGQRLYSEGIDTPFKKIKKSLDYKNLDEAKDEIKKIAEEIKIYGFDDRALPITCVFLGYGNVSSGAQEIFDLLPHEKITAQELLTLKGRPNLSRNLIYKVVFKEEDLVEPKSGKFVLKDYYDNPDKYVSKFERYADKLSIIINCIYWDPKYPRMLTKIYLKKLFSENSKSTIKVIGDITCDVEGSIECTLQTTESGNPIYVYDPIEEKINFGYSGRGVVVLAVDNLPCELPIDSSKDFSKALTLFVPEIVKSDWSKEFEKLQLSKEIEKAVILHKGKLTPDYAYISEYLKES